MRYKSIFFILIVIVFIFSAFQAKKVDVESDIEVKTVEDLIALKVEERIKRYKKTAEERCEIKVMSRANKIVDSLLIDRARKTIIIDSIQKPPIPSKPEKPEVPILNDTTPIRPFLEENDSN